ncbi:hypothetical protein UFOVP54_75 [uncultured Caudovirales phage]|uniref:Uncharacterized protein n=1 Tax=uncultured Caudovirales phage TaxID=2100421 RepID=A0A6J5KVU5_9CAUD|nr:hypothetical protein UFOVP54_75 [uncultured Caudovirales phage]
MTLSEFKYLAADTTVGLSTLGFYVSSSYWSSSYSIPAVGGSEIIVLFNTYAGSVVKVDAIGVKISDYTLEDLEQVTSIDLHIPGIGPIVNVPASDTDVPFVRIEKTVNGPYFIYAISPEDQRPIIIPPTTGSYGYEEYRSNVALEYASITLMRKTGDYDLELAINKARESIYTYKCDRVNPTPASKTNPINLSNILNNAAPLASVQDSNYTSTPWTNARYEGSKIDNTTNTGTDPFLQGTFFQGAFFTKEVTDAYIENLVKTGNITYIDYFAVGNQTTPAYTVESLNLKLSTDIQNTASILETTTTTLPASNKNIKVGDLLQIANSSRGTFADEVIKVNNPNPPALYYPYEFLVRSDTTGETSKINTLRNYTNNSRNSYLTNDLVFRIVPIQILQIGKAKTTAVEEGRIKVRGIDGILSISRDGYIVSGSTRTVI